MGLGWLLGAWAPIDGYGAQAKPDPSLYCATDTGFTFSKDGKYIWEGEAGNFSLNGNMVLLTNRMNGEEGEPGARRSARLAQKVGRLRRFPRYIM